MGNPSKSILDCLIVDKTASGSGYCAMALGTTPVSNEAFRLQSHVTGNVSAFGVRGAFTIDSDVTTSFTAFSSGASTQAAAFALTVFNHYLVVAPSLGAGSSIVTQVGMLVPSDFTGATNNYGILNQMDSGANRLFINSTGSAASFHAGAFTVGAAITAQSTTAIPAGGTAGAGYKFSSTANFGVFFGSGAPTLAAAQGSLYLRSNGSSTSTRAYINTDGNTTWTAVTTAA